MITPPATAIVIGPTAGGKTSLAVACAHLFAERGGSAEIVSADSMLIYRGLDIGSAKPTMAERGGVHHHLIDICEPADAFSAAQWLTLATSAIADIRGRGAWPIVVGGTHLYVKMLVDGLFEGPSADEAIRARLGALSPAQLRARLEEVDPVQALKLHPNDLRRTIRALEVFELTGIPMSSHQRQWDQPAGAGAEHAHGNGADAPPPAQRVLVGLDWPPELINPRINARVRSMMERGLLDEVKALHARGAFGPQAREALGYKQLLAHLEGRMPLDDAVEQIKIETRRFAKNQRTWAKRLRPTPGSLRIDAATVPPEQWPLMVLEACSAHRPCA